MIKWFDLPQPAADLPAAEFADAAGATAWLGRQPQAMPAKFQLALAEQLERLSAQPLDAFTRATVLEALRHSVVVTHGLLRRKFAFQPRPLAGEARDVFSASVRLWDALATGYLQCLEAFADDPVSDPLRLATAVHRGLITCRLALEDHFAAGAEPPEGLWLCLHRLNQAGFALKVAETAVADPEFRTPAESTPASQYILAVLLALADPYRWTNAHLTVMHRAFARWRNQAQLAVAKDETAKLRWIPLSTVSALPPPLGEHSPAWLEVHQIRRKLRKRIEALDAGETPEALHLGRELTPPACRALLETTLAQLRAAYSEAAAGGPPVATDCRLAIGPLGCYQLLTGKPFANPAALSTTSSRLAHERVAIFGQSERNEVAERQAGASGELWRLDAETLASEDVSRPANAPGARMVPGQLALLRDGGGGLSFAVVVRASWRQDERVRASLRRLPGKPDAIEGRAFGMPNEPAFPMFMLPATPTLDVAASLVIPTGVAPRLRDGLEGKTERTVRYRLSTLIERGADFERYAFEAL